MTPVDQLRRAALLNPAARIHWADRSVTYAELMERSLRCAGALHRLGVRKGDRVAFWLPNCLAYLELLYACLHLGAIAVSLNTRFRRSEAQAILSRSRANAIVLWPGFKDIPFLAMLSELEREAIPNLRLAILVEAQASAPPLPAGLTGVLQEDLIREEPVASASAPDFPAVVFPTTGTTSLPKFALHRQGDIAKHADHVAPALGYDAPDAHLLQAVPFCGVWGFSQWIGTVAGAASATLMTLFEPVEAGRLIRERWVTHMNGPDDLVKRLLDAQDETKPFPAMREIVYATFNPTLPNLNEEAEARGLTLVNAFGMSEIFSLFSVQSRRSPPSVRKLSGGVPVNPRAIVRVRDPETGELAAVGQIGGLEIRSDTIFKEYLDDPEATQRAFTDDGFFRTGDLAALTGDGSFVFKGRAGDVLRLGGFLVNPVEIETVLQTLEGVKEAIVVEVPADRGNQPIAFIRCQDGSSFDETAARFRLRELLADFKVPRRFIRVDSFPSVMGANGEKIQRSRLKQMAIDAGSDASKLQN